MLLSALLRRETECSKASRLFSKFVKLQRVYCFELSDNEFLLDDPGGINCIAVDEVEQRYLLCGGADSSVAIFDVLENALAKKVQHKPIARIQRKRGHQYSVSAVQWYAHDTGMFITGSFDEYIKIWDSNALQVACQFRFPGKVFSVAMSPVATRHYQIAGASADIRIRLCDLVSGTFTHSLCGHTDEVWAVQWSPRDEYVLASGSRDCTVRMWDIRSAAGPLVVLDQHSRTSHMHATRRPPAHAGASSSTPTAHSGAVTGLTFTPDGLFLLSSGADDRVRLWDAVSGRNTLVNYHVVHSRQHKRTGLCTDASGEVLVHPSGRSLAMYEVHTGALVRRLNAHFHAVNTCVFHPTRQDMYSAGADGQILQWDPRPLDQDTQQNHPGVAGEDQDHWSD